MPLPPSAAPAGPDPRAACPVPAHPRVGYLKPLLDLPNVEIGEYTYYDDPAGPERFAENILYHFPFIGDRLVIGRFCALAEGCTFIMNGANHLLGGLSTYPFALFGQGWDAVPFTEMEFPLKGDTVVGNDVWIGRRATILPGSRIGDGAVIGAAAVVSGEIPPYAIAVGNPARVIRRRFSGPDIATLQELRWWDWEPERITRAIPALVGGDVAALRALAPD